ncbi:MAG: hypothetical protein LBR27_10100 [Bifidobacteriaceae bacterium]|jgi:hypothetical protein|nr:hypothetical protein [Bifidobacteriaceae bacterium]
MVRRWVAAALVAAAVALAGGTQAMATADAVGAIGQVEIRAKVSQDGTAQVLVLFDWTGPEGEDPQLVFRRRVPVNRDWDRLYEFSGFELQGGAVAADDAVKTRANTVTLTWPAETGPQFKATFTVTGLVQPAEPGAGPDLVEWEALVPGGPVEVIDLVNLQLDGPVGATLVRCWTGPAGDQEPCPYAGTELGDAVFRAEAVAQDGSLTVTAGFANGTFDYVPAPLVRAGGPLWFLRFHYAPWAWVLGGIGLALAGCAVAVARVRRGEAAAGAAAAPVEPDAAAVAAARVAWRGFGAVTVLAAGMIAVLALGLGATGLLGPAAGLFTVGVMVFSLAEYAPVTQGGQTGEKAGRRR